MRGAAVGRVGALALALGIGLALPGVAAAAPEDASESPAEAPSAGRAEPSATRAERPGRASRPGPPVARGRHSVADDPERANGRGFAGPRAAAESPVGDAGPRAAAVIAPSPPVQPAARVSPARDVDVPSGVAVPVWSPAPAAAAAAVPAAPPVASIPVGVIAAPVAAQQAAAPAMTAAPVGRITADALPGSLSGTNPVAPQESPVSWVVLAAVRRQPGAPEVAPAATVAPAAVVTNKPPVIAKVVAGTPNATTGVVTGTVTASDPNGDTMTYKATTSSKGAVSITNGGVFTYTPTATARHAAAKVGAPTAATTDTVTVVVTDAKGASATTTATVAVSPTNTAPVATKTVGAPDGRGVVTGTVTATDADKDTLTYTAASSTAKGTVSLNAATGSFTYTPTAAARNTAAGAYATAADKADTVTVTVTDGYGASVAVPVAVTVSPKSYVSFVFNYKTGTQLWTPASQSALQLAADTVASYLVVAAPVTIVYDVTAANTPTSQTLATATSDLVRTGSGFYSTVVQNKIQTGVDANGAAPDGVVNINFGKNWGYGSAVGASQYDFTATTMHEFVHTLGMITYANQAGRNTGQIWTRFDSFIVTSGNAKVIGTDLRWKTAYNRNLTGANGGLFFSGPNAVAAYGGLVPLYTPSPWAAGSSLNHLRDAAFSGANRKLMNAIVSLGPGIRKLSPVELGILKDLGYTVVPVPGATAVLFVGVFLLRRRRGE